MLLVFFIPFSARPAVNADSAESPRLNWHNRCAHELSSPVTPSPELVEGLIELEIQGSKLLSKFPPAEWQYVFVGRSVAPMAARFKADGLTACQTFFLPLSFSDYNLDDFEVHELADIFDIVLNQIGVVKDGKKTLFIDWVDRGGTIQSLIHVVGRSHISLENSAFAVFSKSLPENLRRLDNSKISHFAISKNLDHLFMTKAFKPMAPTRTVNFSNAREEIANSGCLLSLGVNTLFKELVRERMREKLP